MCNVAHVQWDDLRYVLALERHKTLTAASKSLSVNHTTVSRRLAALEEKIGARLFDKTPQGYLPTAAGIDVIAVAKRVEEEMHSLDRDVLGKDTRLSGPLRITTIDIIAAHLVRGLADFSVLYPDVELELSVDNAPRSLTQREADVAVRVTNAPPENLYGRKLGHMEFAVYGHADLVAAHEHDMVNYERYPWVAWDERANARLTEKWMNKHIPNAKIVFRVDSSATMLASVRSGVGLSFLPVLCADPYPELVRVREIEPNFGMGLWLLTHPDLKDSARIRAFFDHMRVVVDRREAFGLVAQGGTNGR